MSKRSERMVRVAGVIVAAGSLIVAAYVTSKLYTGRGGATPVRAAIYEQPLVAILGCAGVALGLWMAGWPGEFAATRRWFNLKWVWRERRGEALLLCASFVAGLFMLETGSRAMYARDQGLPYWHPPAYLVYPPLYHAFRDYSPDTKNVLLLGGSVLNGAGRDGRLEAALGEGWRVYNVAQNAHSSLDSLTKYTWLTERGYTFDYVIFYHGINEVRANNAPPEVFREDYSHYLFYRLVHTVFGDGHPIRRTSLHSALVFRADRLIAQLRDTKTLGRNFVNMAYPREDWLQYGGDIRSAESFESNLLAIAELARTNGATLLVGEFAYDPRLDALKHDEALSGDEMIKYTKEWGLPRHVRSGIVSHNEVIRAHAAEYVVVDTDAVRRPENFIDPCHFTETANESFVALLADAVRAAAR